MYLLEPMSAEPTSSLYESVDQPLPSSSASPQCISRLNFEESLIAVKMLMMLGSSDLTKTSDRVFSHSTSPHWSAAKRSSPIKSYRRRTVCLFPDPSSCQTRRLRNRLLLICHHIIDCDKGGEYPRPWFATASDLLWYAACYEHPYSSPYPQCDSDFVCCQTVCLTVARPSVVESALRKRPMTEPPFICLFPDRLLVCCQTLSVCCQTLQWRSQPFVCLLPLVKLITKREVNITQCPKFATALDSPWYAACHGHP